MFSQVTVNHSVRKGGGANERNWTVWGNIPSIENTTPSKRLGEEYLTLFLLMYQFTFEISRA